MLLGFTPRELLHGHHTVDLQRVAYAILSTRRRLRPVLSVPAGQATPGLTDASHALRAEKSRGLRPRWGPTVGATSELTGN